MKLSQLNEKAASSDVKTFIDKVNRKLATHTGSIDERKKVIAAAEKLLAKTGGLDRIELLDVDEVPDGYMPGVRGDLEGKRMFGSTDDTRVRFVLK